MGFITPGRMRTRCASKVNSRVAAAATAVRRRRAHWGVPAAQAARVSYAAFAAAAGAAERCQGPVVGQPAHRRGASAAGEEGVRRTPALGTAATRRSVPKERQSRLPPARSAQRASIGVRRACHASRRPTAGRRRPALANVVPRPIAFAPQHAGASGFQALRAIGERAGRYPASRLSLRAS